MKVTVYTRLEKMSELNLRLKDTNNSSPIDRELFITENAQRTHFQGWCEVQIPYDDFVRLTDLKPGF
jgi:hypothetical protein